MILSKSQIYFWLKKTVDVEPYEVKALILSMVYFFSLLCSYYIIRPIRDEMGIAGGIEYLQWLFSGTFIAMIALVPLFGWITSRYPKSKFIPYVYYFFIANLLIFFFLFKSDITHAYIARAFFIWTSVFNLFVVSVFWSFMADIYNKNQSKRLFGFIASGGTIGALTGPLLTSNLVLILGPANLIPLSVLFLIISVLCINRLTSSQSNLTGSKNNGVLISNKYNDSKTMGGGIIDAFRLVLVSPYLIGICVLIFLFTTLATFLYFQQAEIIRDSFSDPSKRTSVFASIDFAVNSLTIIIQFFLTGRIVKSIGLSWTLALIPILLGIGFFALATAPLLPVIIVVQILRRAGNYAIMRPAREMLFTVLGIEEKYKAKNFIDTAVYRGGDAISAWAYAGLSGLGLSLSAIAFIAVPISAIWAAISYYLGKRREIMAGNINN
jgi:AAA family ATP:ADP antiporter